MFANNNAMPTFYGTLWTPEHNNTSQLVSPSRIMKQNVVYFFCIKNYLHKVGIHFHLSSRKYAAWKCEWCNGKFTRTVWRSWILKFKCPRFQSITWCRLLDGEFFLCENFFTYPLFDLNICGDVCPMDFISVLLQCLFV